MGKRATPTLSGSSSASPRQCTQGRPRRHWAPRAGVWPARGCRSCRHFAGLRPVAGKMPALPGPRFVRRAHPLLRRPERHEHIRRHHRLRVPLAKVHEPVPDTDPSASSLRLWNCPAAHGLRAALGCRSWERGRPARKRATGPPHGQAGDAHALGLLQCQSSAVHPRPTSTALGASGGGVAGSGVSLLSALCGQDARACMVRPPHCQGRWPRLGLSDCPFARYRSCGLGGREARECGQGGGQRARTVPESLFTRSRALSTGLSTRLCSRRSARTRPRSPQNFPAPLSRQCLSGRPPRRCARSPARGRSASASRR